MVQKTFEIVMSHLITTGYPNCWVHYCFYLYLCASLKLVSSCLCCIWNMECLSCIFPSACQVWFTLNSGKVLIVQDLLSWTCFTFYHLPWNYLYLCHICDWICKKSPYPTFWGVHTSAYTHEPSSQLAFHSINVLLELKHYTCISVQVCNSIMCMFLRVLH